MALGDCCEMGRQRNGQIEVVDHGRVAGRNRRFRKRPAAKMVRQARISFAHRKQQRNMFVQERLVCSRSAKSVRSYVTVLQLDQILRKQSAPWPCADARTL